MEPVGNAKPLDRPLPLEGPSSSRVGIYDAVRGFSVISMVLFHLCYDLKFIEGMDLAWFAPPLQDIWRCSISWTFVFVAGCMFQHSRDNLRRAVKYGLVALVIWVVTTIAAVDVPINFGIIYCMAACTLATRLLDALGVRPAGPAAALLLLATFLALQGLQHGRVWLFGIGAQVPEALYSTPWLSWLGFPGPHFSSGDYYPLLPYLLLYLAGDAMASSWKSSGYPTWAREAHAPLLSLTGKHALLVYVLHQPILLGVSMLLGAL